VDRNSSYGSAGNSSIWLYQIVPAFVFSDSSVVFPFLGLIEYNCKLYIKKKKKKVGHTRIQDFLYFKFCLFHDSDFILYSIHFMSQILFCDMLYIDRQYMKWKRILFFGQRSDKIFVAFTTSMFYAQKEALVFSLFIYLLRIFWFFSSLNWVWV